MESAGTVGQSFLTGWHGASEKSINFVLVLMPCFFCVFLFSHLRAKAGGAENKEGGRDTGGASEDAGGPHLSQRAGEEGVHGRVRGDAQPFQEQRHAHSHICVRTAL